MYAAYGRNTMLGAERIAMEKARADVSVRQQLQRELYQAKLEEARHIAEIRRVAEERRETLQQEMRDRGYAFKHTYREIERRAAKLFKIHPTHIRGAGRKREVCFARQFVMYWTARLCGYSYPQIGRLMGDRDHTTVLHGARVYPEKRAYMGRNLRKAR